MYHVFSGLVEESRPNHQRLHHPQLWLTWGFLCAPGRLWLCYLWKCPLKMRYLKQSSKCRIACWRGPSALLKSVGPENREMVRWPQMTAPSLIKPASASLGQTPPLLPFQTLPRPLPSSDIHKTLNCVLLCTSGMSLFSVAQLYVCLLLSLEQGSADTRWPN